MVYGNTKLWKYFVRYNTTSWLIGLQLRPTSNPHFTEEMMNYSAMLPEAVPKPIFLVGILVCGQGYIPRTCDINWESCFTSPAVVQHPMRVNETLQHFFGWSKWR